jgi:hypothetical protein
MQRTSSCLDWTSQSTKIDHAKEVNRVWHDEWFLLSVIEIWWVILFYVTVWITFKSKIAKFCEVISTKWIFFLSIIKSCIFRFFSSFFLWISIKVLRKLVIYYARLWIKMSYIKGLRLFQKLNFKTFSGLLKQQTLLQSYLNYYYIL